MSIKLAICTPTAGAVRIEYADSIISTMRALQNDTYCKVTAMKYFFIVSSVIPYNRMFLVEQAMKWGATHVLFVDDDMAFPPEAVKQLLRSHKLPIVAANCVKRVYPLEFMALDFSGNEVKSQGITTGVEEVMLAGNSLVLIRTEVFRAMEKPWFTFTYLPEDNHFETEDYYFQKKARELGFKTYVDHDASKAVIHIGQHNFDAHDNFHKVKK